MLEPDAFNGARPVLRGGGAGNSTSLPDRRESSVSYDLLVYLRRSAMPTPQRWRAAIRDAGFPLDLGVDFDVDSSSGFRPCDLLGAAAGFEYYSSPVSESARAELAAPPDCDFSVMLTTGADERELAASIMAAGALCHASGGVLVDPQSGEDILAERALAWARQKFSEIEVHLR